MSLQIETEPVASITDARSIVERTLRVQIAHYDHPLMKELRFALDSVAHADVGLAVQHTAETVDSRLQDIAAGVAASAKQEVTESLDRDNANGLKLEASASAELDEIFLGQNPNKKARTKFRNTHEQASRAAKWELLEDIRNDDPIEHAITEASRDELAGAVVLATAAMQRRIETLAIQIADTLEPRRGRLLTAVIGKTMLSRWIDVLPNLQRGSFTANLHRDIGELIEHLNGHSDPSIIGKEAAYILEPRLRERVKANVTERYSAFKENAQAKLAAYLKELCAGSNLSVQEVFRVEASNPSKKVWHTPYIPPQKVESQDVAELDSVNKLAAQKGRQNERLTSNETKKEPVFFHKVGVGKKVGNAIHIENLHDDKLSGDNLRIILDTLMQLKMIKSLTSRHPRLEGTIREVIENLLRNPYCQGTEDITDSNTTIIDGNGRMRKGKMRECSIRRASTSGTSDPNASGIRVFYIVDTNMAGRKTFVLRSVHRKQGGLIKSVGKRF